MIAPKKAIAILWLKLLQPFVGRGGDELPRLDFFDRNLNDLGLGEGDDLPLDDVERVVIAVDLHIPEGLLLRLGGRIRRLRGHRGAGGRWGKSGLIYHQNLILIG